MKHTHCWWWGLYLSISLVLLADCDRVQIMSPIPAVKLCELLAKRAGSISLSRVSGVEEEDVDGGVVVWCVWPTSCVVLKGLSVTSSICCIAASVQRLDDFQTILIICLFLFFFFFCTSSCGNDDYILESVMSVLYVFGKTLDKKCCPMVFFFSILVMWNILKCCWIQIKIQCKYHKASKFVLRVFINTNVFLFISTIQQTFFILWKTESSDQHAQSLFKYLLSLHE